MDPIIKGEWLVALRSGDYPQGRCQLRSKHNKFCCLGVLCEISGKTTWQPNPDSEGYIYLGSAGVLPKAVAEAAKIEPEVQSMLIAKNDAGRSFAEIADWIEKNL
jgi:hypothetical protein